MERHCLARKTGAASRRESREGLLDSHPLLAFGGLFGHYWRPCSGNPLCINTLSWCGQTIRQQHPDFDVFGKVVIEDWAYIGAFSQIMPEVTIGEGALVAAGSVVTKSVAPHTVVGGNPTRYICTTEEYYERNKKFNVATKGKSLEEKKNTLLGLPAEKFVRK